MEPSFRELINKFKKFKIINEAIKTKCQTEGAVYKTDISKNDINIKIEIPFELKLDEDEAKLLENNIHNVLELVLAPHFKK